MKNLFSAATAGVLGLSCWLGGTAFGEPRIIPPIVERRVEAVLPGLVRGGDLPGDVVLIVTVGKDGTVESAEVELSGGSDADQAALAAIRGWAFKPARRDGVPVASRIRVPVRFAKPETEAPDVRQRSLPQEAFPAKGAGSDPPVVGQGTPIDSPEEPTGGGTSVEPVSVDVRGQAGPVRRGASDYRISREILAATPHATAADMLSTAPGAFVAHPEGDAVAQRVYLRGFDAEHGQDIEFKVSGIPLNQPSHIHGQGYADLNLIIPETVRSLRVIEGVYDPRQADFAVAGTVEYDLGVEERRSRVKVSGGSFGTRRLLALWAPEGEPQETFGAAAFRQTDGFGEVTRGATSGGILGQYKVALAERTVALVHLGAYAARANMAGVLRRDDIEAGRVGFYDAYPDPSARSQSAGTSRTQIGLSLERTHPSGVSTSAGIWAYLANFRSRMNFTGYMERSEVDPTWVGRGDLIEQANADLGVGGALSHRAARHQWSWLGAQLELGGDVRTHRIEQAQNLLRAPQNETWDRRVDASVAETDVGLFGDVLLSARQYVRLRVGARAELLSFDVDDRLGNFIPAFERRTHIVGFRRTATGVILGPRTTLDVNPATWLRVSTSYGEGYRSPQARQLEEGEQAPFARVRACEAGVTLHDATLSLTATAYETRLSYDLAFDPTEGRLERLGPTTRRGVVGYLVGSPEPWLDAAVSSTFVDATLDSPPTPTPDNPTPPYIRGQSLPYVPPLVVRSDVAVHGDVATLAGRALEARVGYGTAFLSARPLPYGQSSPPIFVLDATAGLRRDWLELTVDAANLLGARYADTEYTFVSNWLSTRVPSRLPARHITAAAPRSILASVTVYL